MMHIIAANEPADLVALGQGIAGSTDGRRVPALIELGVGRLIVPVGAVGIHPAGVLSKSKFTDAVQGLSLIHI